VTSNRLAVSGVSGLGLVTLLTAALAAMAPRTAARPPAVMPDPTPEQLAVAPAVETQSLTDMDTCNDAGVTAVVVRGRITSLDPSMQARFRIRLADVPSRYEAVTGDDGQFEVRIPRRELGATNLCELPIRGVRPAAAAFAGSSMTVQYQLHFER
jgi:hypothetical protein